MKRYILPFIIAAFGLVVADYLFGLDIRDLFAGAVDFIRNIIAGG